MGDSLSPSSVWIEAPLNDVRIGSVVQYLGCAYRVSCCFGGKAHLHGQHNPHGKPVVVDTSVVVLVDGSNVLTPYGE